MLQILLHSSKTMAAPHNAPAPLGTPQYLDVASELVNLWRRAEHRTIETRMKISPQKSIEVRQMLVDWSPNTEHQTPAVDTFHGDIYSGLQVSAWSEADRHYAHDTLTILSGLYGTLRACDGVMPYRLEMGYKLPDGTSLYKHWGSRLAHSLPDDTSHLLNLSAVEYTKSLLPFTDLPVTTPRFLTVQPKTSQPAFVVVHAKIARGAFASWVIRNRIIDVPQLTEFNELGYTYNHDLSTPNEPVFICQTFQGIGLSTRIKKTRKA